MKNWKDQHKIVCLKCKHSWTLISNKMITNEEFNNWFIKTLQQHEEIHSEIEGENE